MIKSKILCYLIARKYSCPCRQTNIDSKDQQHSRVCYPRIHVQTTRFWRAGPSLKRDFRINTANTSLLQPLQIVCLRSRCAFSWQRPVSVPIRISTYRTALVFIYQCRSLKSGFQIALAISQQVVRPFCKTIFSL